MSLIYDVIFAISIWLNERFGGQKGECVCARAYRSKWPVRYIDILDFICRPYEVDHCLHARLRFLRGQGR